MKNYLVCAALARDAMRKLAFREHSIVAGESGAARLAGLLSIAGDPEVLSRLGLNEHSRILHINIDLRIDLGVARSKDTMGRG
ncbi:UNVERIFIED_ORG: threonine dehydratase [Rhizobium aethiopicum]|uniref:hypothetical protein n=1 Tax=Rhizobium sp. N122 TaxID=1764272 RepID=UPI000B5A51BC|nr:hypothetical protein [Rhizobium sp. N122]OWV85998.1 hypothetical protein ATY75_23675 [Rhizobium sp. N122]